MKRVLKIFHESKYNHEVRVLESKVKAYNDFVTISDRLSKGAKSMDDLVKYVNGSTGFNNPRVSADALGILDEFSRCIELEAVWSGLNFNALDEDGIFYKISPKHLDDLKELYRVYYDDEQSKQILALEKIAGDLNKLDLPYRLSLGYNHIDKAWSWSKQHTDNYLAESSRGRR